MRRCYRAGACLFCTVSCRCLLCLTHELLFQPGNIAMLAEVPQNLSRQLFQILLELGTEMLMQQLSQAGGGSIEVSGGEVRVIQAGFYEILHLLQHRPPARPNLERKPVAVLFAVQPIINRNTS